MTKNNSSNNKKQAAGVLLVIVLALSLSGLGVYGQSSSGSETPPPTTTTAPTTGVPPTPAPITSQSGSQSGSGSGSGAGLFNRAKDLLKFNISGTIYTRGDMIMRNPVEGCTIFVTAVLAASVIEWLIDYLRDIDSASFQLVFESAREETLIVGLMTLILLFVVSLGVLRDKWVVMLNYAVMSLLGMVIFFIFIISGMVVTSRVSTNKWRDFETSRMNHDKMLKPREELYKKCADHYFDSLKVKEAQFSNTMLFADYLRKTQRFTVARIADLSWKAWAALGLLIIINGVRSRFTTGTKSATGETILSNTDRFSNVATYIAFVGYGTLVFYFAMHYRLLAQLKKFTEEPIAKAAEYDPSKIIIATPSERLFFGSMETTSHIIQMCILFMEWYLAVFGLGMVFESWRNFGPISLLLYLAALIPPVVFVLQLPWTITIMTTLNSLGEDLHMEEAEKCYNNSVRETGGQAIVDKDATGNNVQQTERNDEFNGEMVTFHETAGKESKVMLDTSVPLAIHDARHVNVAPRDQHGFEKVKAKPVFPLLLGDGSGGVGQYTHSGPSKGGGRQGGGGSQPRALASNASDPGSPTGFGRGQSFVGSPSANLMSNASFAGGGGTGPFSAGGSSRGSAFGGTSPSFSPRLLGSAQGSNPRERGGQMSSHGMGRGFQSEMTYQEPRREYNASDPFRMPPDADEYANFL